MVEGSIQDLAQGIREEMLRAESTALAVPFAHLPAVVKIEYCAL